MKVATMFDIQGDFELLFPVVVARDRPLRLVDDEYRIHDCIEDDRSADDRLN
jgi:hypothetical protein